MALYGSKKDGKTGFIRQLGVLFSPDGYFTEGPYYQRYAIWPFMTFAQVIQNHQPELKIFNYRNGILFKAVNTLLQSAYNGEIVYLNDALTKTYKTQEIVYAVDIAYKNNPTDYSLLDIARQQGSFFVSDAGLAAAKAIKNKMTKPFFLKSMIVRDGKDGNEGGVAFLRNNNSLLTLKATSHGLSHGHYDKLSLSYFDNGNQILTDYGAARFLNIEPKNGGNYTKENYTWAMQTIAHNTVTVNEKSHFDANIKVSSNFHSDIQYSDISNKNIQILSAVDTNAYKGVKMQRTSTLINNAAFEFPIVVDIFKVLSDQPQTLDFPFYYRGQLVSTSFKTTKNVSELKPLGTKNGYQHLWLEAIGQTEKPNACFTFVNGNRFYSISTVCDQNTEFMLTRVGANDPDFNLRPEAAFMLRQTKTVNHTFASIIEPHGLYDLSREITVDFQTVIKYIEILKDDNDFTAVEIQTNKEKSFLMIIANKGFDTNAKRTVEIKNKKYSFTGNYLFKETTN